MKIITLLLIASTQLLAKLPTLNALHELPAIDVALEMNKSLQNTDKSQPLQFAIPTEVSDVFVKNGKSKGGQWDQLKDGSWVWRFEVFAENALSLDFGLFDFYMPPTAELSFYDQTGDLVKGPFTDTKNKPHKQFWPGTIIGNNVTVELRVAAKYKRFVSFSIKNINQGFRSIWEDVDLIPKMGQQKFWLSSSNISFKSLSCNIDVACDDGNEWRDQIRSVARYTITKSDGTFLCTGQMINNTANDGKPLFLTANHCGFNSTTDASINLWWNYESNQCRTPGSSASGTVINIATFNDTQSGSTFKASNQSSDFALLELDDIPPASYQVFYTGWDRRDIAPASAAGIHHPGGEAKRISIENSTVQITSSNSSLPGGSRNYLYINGWDFGTTEGGSSGSGLWNEDKLLVGQLSSGTLECGNDDWYGRFNKSWEGGGTPNSRLKEWLDPDNTGVETLQGLGECSPMTVSISHTSNSEEIGVIQNFSASVSGGVAPYTYSWDINADGSSDGNSSSITATYSQQFVGNVNVGITDADGCTGGKTKAVVIQSPEIKLLSPSGTSEPAVEQICGNNDNFIDPGERWRVPVAIQNNGFADAKTAYAVFTKNSTSSSFQAVANDKFGNSLGACDKQFIDISGTGTDLNLIAVSADYPAQDDGVAAVSLSQPFNLYGQTINGLYLSTNGYISTDPNENGSDFDNDCPLPTTPNQGSTQARIIPLHNDLIVQNIYHQHFTSCPRAASPSQDIACDVFMYSGVDLYNADDPTVENFNFEAILYPEINLWVYQYDGEGINPASTIGLQNNNASDGAHYSCGSTTPINTQEAVCIYHKNFPDTSGGDTSKLYLETPVIALGDMPVSTQRSGFITFSVDESAECGSPIGIDMQAVVYEAGFNQDNSSLFSAELGNNGSCSVVNNCSANGSNTIQPTNGLWYNINRSGNGNDMYFLDNALVYVQYTALEDRSPIWYITGANGYYQNNQAYNDLNKHEYNGPFLNSTRTITQVGESHTTIVDANTAIQTRTINGKFSADLMQSFIFSNAATPKQRTGLWYNASKPGWGLTVGTQGDTEVVISYLFDDNGQPYWVLGSDQSNAEVKDIPMSYFKAFCSHCPTVPLDVEPVGSVRINYNEPTATKHTATLENLNISHPNNSDLIWQRNDVPFTLLTPQQD